MARIYLLAIVATLAAQALASSKHWCLYFVDAKDGNVYRSRLDGSHREMVVACKAKRNVGFASTWPQQGNRGSLMLTNVPSYAGYSLVDAAPAGQPIGKVPAAFPHGDVMGRSAFRPAPVLWTDNGKPSGWQLQFDGDVVQLEPHHTHARLRWIVLSNGRVTRRVAAQNEGSLLGLFSDGKAVVRSGSSVILWDLASNKQTIVAQVVDATAWFRDLRKKDRIKPVASALVQHGAPGLVAGRYSWVMKDPSDFTVKPEYLRRAFRTP